MAADSSMNNIPESVRNILPKRLCDLQIASNIDRDVVGGPIYYLLENCVHYFYHDTEASLGLSVSQDESSGQDNQSSHIGSEVIKANGVHNPSECVQFAQDVINVTWERLNTGYWKDVHISWRYMYSYATLFKVLGLLSMNSYLKKDVVKACDMGLLMGAPILDNILSKISEIICKESQHEHHQENEEADLTKLQAKKQKTEHCPVLQGGISRLNCPSLETFQKQCMANKCPAIIENAIDYWPALSTNRWSLSYLVKVAGLRTVPIEIGQRYTDELWSQKLITIKDFVDEYILNKKGNVGYLAQHQLFDQVPELRNDISIPTYCCLSDSDDDDDVEINAWFGPAGTVSPLHHDPKHNLLAQVVGEKYIRLYVEEMTEYLYPHEEHLLNNTSQVDVENPDLERFPLFRNASYVDCILRSGEMLYIPPRCWHFVRSLSTSFSVSFWWS